MNILNKIEAVLTEEYVYIILAQSTLRRLRVTVLEFIIVLFSCIRTTVVSAPRKHKPAMFQI